MGRAGPARCLSRSDPRAERRTGQASPALVPGVDHARAPWGEAGVGQPYETHQGALARHCNYDLHLKLTGVNRHTGALRLRFLCCCPCIRACARVVYHG